MREQMNLSKSRAYMERKLRQLKHKEPLIEKFKKGEITLKQFHDQCKSINRNIK